MNPLEFRQKQKEQGKSFLKEVQISNSLVEAFIKKNNAVGFKILFYIATKRKMADNEIIKVSINDLCKVCNIKKAELRNNIKKIMNTIVTHIQDDKITDTVIIYQAIYDHRMDTLSLKIPSNIYEMLVDVSKKYTIIDVPNLMSLKNKHSIKFIQLLEQISRYDEFVGKRKSFTLEALNGYFGVNYRNYTDLENKILKKVKNELDNNSKLSFSYRFVDEKNTKLGRPKIEKVTIDVIQKNTVQGKLL